MDEVEKGGSAVDVDAPMVTCWGGQGTACEIAPLIATRAATQGLTAEETKLLMEALSCQSEEELLEAARNFYEYVSILWQWDQENRGAVNKSKSLSSRGETRN